MRYRGISVYTNTTPRGAQRGPGQNEMAPILAPLTDKLAQAIDMSRVRFRQINALRSDGYQGGSQGPVTSSFISEALAQGQREFNWEEREQLPRDLGW